ncbi:MAG: WG repeat-containing protein [Fibromonadales bacterium]|nr:WG repeat-containing protein [Fibromonadales bacterium]
MFWAADAKWYFDNAKAKNFTISSAEELEKLAQIVNGNWIRKPENFAGKTITLSEDIDLLRYNNDWKPIGDSASSFSGTFDGGEHTIKGLSINRPNADRQGLFGRISKGKVQNLRLDGVNIRGRNHVGAIAGIVSMGSNLTNCYSSGKINGNKSVGGITGFAGDTSKVISSYSAGEVKGDTAVGGIAGGINKYSQVISNYSTSTVNGRFGVGGIAGGLFNNSIVFSSYSTGAVSGNESIGGVAGDVRNKSEVISCAALNREVKGTGTSVGRVAGFIDAKETLSDNVAFDEMKNSAGNTKWAKKGTSAKDGADITVVAINRDGTIGGRFTAANGWVVQNGSLPTIGKPKTTSPQTQKTAELEPINITDSSMYYIPVKDNNDFHKYIALDGKSITEAKYARAYVFREGRALVQEKDGTWGYIDTKGNDIAKGYTQGTSFREGIAWVNDDGVIKAINPNGNVVKTLPRDIISIWPFYEDLALFSSDGGQNYLDKDFNVAFNENFLDGNRFQENMASIMCDNGKYGYIDKNINYITDCEFDDARIFKNSKAIVRVGKGLGIINEQGKYILQPSDDIEAITHDGDMFRFKKKDGNWGWLNSNGQIAIQPNFIEAMNFGNRDIAPVRQDSLWGYIDKSGKYAISLQYRVAYPFINGRAFVKFADGYFATIDRNGRKDLQTNYQKFDNSYWEVINSGIAAEPKIMTVKPSSFNCASKLAGDYERIICKSFSLINLDNKMNSLYVNKKNDPDIAKSNKVFLAERNNCKDASCLERVYEARIDELESMSVVFP